MFNSPATYRMEFSAGWSPAAGKYFDTKRQRDDWAGASGSRKIRD